MAEDSKVVVTGGVRDSEGRVLSAEPDAPTAPVPLAEQQIINEMQARGLITPTPDLTPVIEPYSGPVFTLHDEYDRVVCGLIPPQTYVVVSPERFQYDAFHVIAELLRSPEGQRLIAARGWRVYLP